MLTILALCFAVQTPEFGVPVNVKSVRYEVVRHGDDVELMIIARGEVPATTYRYPRLTARFHRTGVGIVRSSPDGYFEFDFLAKPNSCVGKLEATVIEAVTFEPYFGRYPYKVRVYGADGSKAEFVKESDR